MRVRHASSSMRPSDSQSPNRASPPNRPEKGPPAKMCGGSWAKASSSPSMYAGTPAAAAPGQPASSAGISRSTAAATISSSSAAKKATLLLRQLVGTVRIESAAPTGRDGDDGERLFDECRPVDDRPRAELSSVEHRCRDELGAPVHLARAGTSLGGVAHRAELGQVTRLR